MKLRLPLFVIPKRAVTAKQAVKERLVILRSAATKNLLFARFTAIFAFLLFLTLSLGAADRPEWTRPFPPFRIAGNLYYVGSEDLAAYLLTTPRGNILINSNLAILARGRSSKASRNSASSSPTRKSCSSAMLISITARAAPKS